MPQTVMWKSTKALALVTDLDPLLLPRRIAQRRRQVQRRLGLPAFPLPATMAKSPQEGSSMTKTALVTGFEPYGGHTLNPSAKVALALDGAEIGGLRIVGRVWPVTFAGLLQRLEAALDEAQPAVVIALGLCPGEPMIRLERFGVNLADFEIADNSGEWLKDAPIARDGATARTATLPLRAIERALLDAGIPARLSNTAGTYLCNATPRSTRCWARSSGAAGASPAASFICPTCPSRSRRCSSRRRPADSRLTSVPILPRWSWR
jgi:pyroglutamyl-peptidase I